MPIRIPGTQTGPFGGPQGSTLQAMLQLMQGYLVGEQKAEEQKQMDLLGKIFGQQPGQPIQPTTRENIVEQILQSRELKPQTRMLGLRAAQALPRYKSPDYMVLKYWDSSGKKHQKRILTSEFNSKVAEIEAAGGTWEEPEKTTDSDYKIIEYWDKNDKKKKKRVLAANYNQRITEIEAQGGTFEGPDKDKDMEEKREKQKNLASLKSDFMQQIGRYYSAKRGVGQFIEDPNKEQIAQEALQSAMNIAKQYVKEGGKWEDLGLQEPGTEMPKNEGYKTPDDVKKAFKEGKIKSEEAIKILQEKFNFK